MTVRASLRASIAMLLLLAPATRAQERIKITVDVDDGGTGGVFRSAFSSAFRSLGDVDVVAKDGEPDYVLDGVILCDPETCKNPTSYAVSLRLYSHPILP